MTSQNIWQVHPSTDICQVIKLCSDRNNYSLRSQYDAQTSARCQNGSRWNVASVIIQLGSSIKVSFGTHSFTVSTVFQDQTVTAEALLCSTQQQPGPVLHLQNKKSLRKQKKSAHHLSPYHVRNAKIITRGHARNGGQVSHCIMEVVLWWYTAKAVVAFYLRLFVTPH